MTERSNISVIDATKSNVISGTDFNTVVTDTCGIIYDTLADHCGPYAHNALIIQHDGRTVDGHNNVFTKDGITIVKHLEFDSELQMRLKDMIAFVGSRVDDISHDGTTTSMMLFADLVRNIIKQKTTEDGISDPVRLKRAISSVISVIQDIIGDNSITIDDLVKEFDVSDKDARAFVAYHQAMVSSKGDVDLSNAIVEVIRNLPTAVYGQFTLSQSGIETDKRFTVETDEFDFTTPAVINDLALLNTSLSTEYVADICDIIISENDLIHGNVELVTLVEYLTPYLNGDATLERDLIIIARQFDSELFQIAMEYNGKHDTKIVMFSVSMPIRYSGKMVLLTAILASAGVCSIADSHGDMSKTIIRGAKIHYRNRQLNITHLYEKDGSDCHPFYTNPDTHPPYTKLVTELKDTLDRFEKGHMRISSAADEAMINDYIELYKRLVCQKVVRLKISGSTHDCLADVSVVRDAFGAVLSSIEHGFVLDGLTTIVTDVGQMLSSEGSKTIGDDSDLLDVGQMLCIVQTCIDSLLSVIHSDKNTKFRLDSDTNKYKFITAPAKEPFMLMKMNECGTNNAIIGITSTVDVEDTTSHVLIQPRRGLQELFKRIGELLPKIATSTCCITPGTLFAAKSTGVST